MLAYDVNVLSYMQTHDPWNSCVGVCIIMFLRKNGTSSKNIDIHVLDQLLSRLKATHSVYTCVVSKSKTLSVN